MTSSVELIYNPQVMHDHGCWQTDQQQWTRICDSARDAFHQLVPVRCGRSALVAHEILRPRLTEPDRLTSSDRTGFDSLALFGRRHHAVSRQRIKAIDAAVTDESSERILQGALQSPPARDDHTRADRAFGMETFEILEVAIVERILRVPLDLTCDRRSRALESSDVINLMGCALARSSVDHLLDTEIMLRPPEVT